MEAAQQSQTPQMASTDADRVVPKGAKTSEYYRVFDIPERFNQPGGCFIPGNPVFSCQVDTPLQQRQPSSDDLFQGYEHKPKHPMYMTTNADYGFRPPTVHNMPTSFHAKSQKFSEGLGKCGMFRNHSLNTAKDVENF